MDAETTVQDHVIREALRQQADEIMRQIGQVFDSDSSDYRDVAYNIMTSAIPEITEQRWRELTGQLCTDWYNCCGWCSEHDEHCGRDSADMDRKCDKGHCHDCEHVCDVTD